MQFEMPLTIDVLPVIEDYTAKVKNPRMAQILFDVATRIYWRTQIAASQDNKCIWCSCEMTHERDQANSVTIEHMIPVSAGGANHPDNYAVACHRCNNRRGSMPAEQFRQRLATGYHKASTKKHDNDDEVVTSRRMTTRRIYALMQKNNQGLSPSERIAANATRSLPEMYAILQSLTNVNNARINDKMAAMKAVLDGVPNPFEPNTRPWREYERFSKNSQWKSSQKAAM